MDILSTLWVLLNYIMHYNILYSIFAHSDRIVSLLLFGRKQFADLWSFQHQLGQSNLFTADGKSTG